MFGRKINFFLYIFFVLFLIWSMNACSDNATGKSGDGAQNNGGTAREFLGRAEYLSGQDSSSITRDGGNSAEHSFQRESSSSLPDGNHHSAPETSLRENASSLEGSGGESAMTSDASNSSPEQSSSEPNLPETPKIKDDGNNISIPDAPDPTPPAGSALNPQIFTVDSFWRFMPGSVYRPIVITSKIQIYNRSKHSISDLKVSVVLYLYNGIVSKAIPLDNTTPSLPKSLRVGYRIIITFNGSTMNHGLPKYQKPTQICGKYYIPVLKFSYRENGIAKSFRMMWRRIPFGCTCYGSQKC